MGYFTNSEVLQKFVGASSPRVFLKHILLSIKGAVVFDKNDSVVWNTCKKNGSEPKSESQALISSFFKLDAGCI